MREPANRPSEGSVLDDHPGILPHRSRQLQTTKGLRPSNLFPWHASNFELNIVSSERAAEITAIFFNSIGGFVAPAEQRYDGLGHRRHTKPSGFRSVAATMILTA